MKTKRVVDQTYRLQQDKPRLVQGSNPVPVPGGKAA